MKKVRVCLAQDFACKKCGGTVKNLKEPVEILCDSVETVTKFSHLGGRLNATGGCDTGGNNQSKNR